MNRCVVVVLVAVFAAVALAGCSGYRVGTLLPPDLRTIHVPTFRNATGEPRLEILVTNAVIERLQEDGTLRVVNTPDADLVIDGQIVSYRRDPVRYRRDDPVATDEYRLRLAAAMTVTNPDTTEVIRSDSWVEGDTDFDVAGDLRSSELRAQPDAAADLARDIVERIVEGW